MHCLNAVAAKKFGTKIAPDGFSNIEDVLPYEQRKAIVRGYAGAAGFAQSQVNKPAGKAA